MDLYHSNCFENVYYLKFNREIYLSKRCGFRLTTDISISENYQVIYCQILNEDKETLNRRFTFVPNGNFWDIEMISPFISSWIFYEDQVFALLYKEE